MIVKMKFLSITGPKADLDRMVNEYLSKYDIHLENALSELRNVEQLHPYIEINPYREWLQKANEFAVLIKDSTLDASPNISLEKCIDFLRQLEENISGIRMKRMKLEEKLEALNASYEKIEPFLAFNYNIHRIMQFKFIKFRFGKIAVDYYDKLAKYVYEDLDTVFYKCHNDGQYIWGIYFVPETHASKIDAVYASMHFERFRLPDEYDGTPQEAADLLNERIANCKNNIKKYQEEMTAELNRQKDMILLSQKKLAALSTNFDVRKLAACTREDRQVFYILCGWMTEKDARNFERDISNDPDLYCIIEDDHNNVISPPPTKLKNPKVFRPFEMYIKMYGLPAYNEIDPTIFVALTYAFIFGAMFGDVGQGIFLMIGGALLYRFKKWPLTAIISCAGFFSAIFGILFGSVFGFEDIIPALWLRPVSHMTTLPFIGKLNTVFIIAIAFGMFLNLLVMILHIINGIKAKDTENAWFDTNGCAGFAFYAAIVTIIALFMTGNKLPSGIVMVIMFVVPLILMALKEPLTRLVEKKADIFPKEKGMFIVQSFFELFEILLSYFSNTLSFVRIGAFAVSHAAMMEVVLMLAGAENGASPNWIVIIVGNLFVCGMEGLIVGIQVLRLEYYELFSRFYKGTGRAFQPFARKNTL